MLYNYRQIQDWIGLSEGGYVNDPDDPGGETDRGITQLTYDNWNRMHGRPRRTVRGISKTEAEQIIEFQYLNAVRCDALPSGLDYAMGDYAVNSGPAQAAKDLQRVLGVAVDGIVGVQTLAAVDAANTQELIIYLCQRRMKFLRGLKGWKKFGKGWTRRVMGDLPGVQTGDIGVADRAVRMTRGTKAIPAPKQSAPGKALPGAGLWSLIVSIVQLIVEGFRHATVR